MRHKGLPVFKDPKVFKATRVSKAFKAFKGIRVLLDLKVRREKRVLLDLRERQAKLGFLVVLEKFLWHFKILLVGIPSQVLAFRP